MAIHHVATHGHAREFYLRSNQAANTNRFLDSPNSVARDSCRDGITIASRGLFAEPLEKVGGISSLAFGLGDRLAILPSDELGNVVGVLNHEVVPLTQHLGTFAAGQGAEARKSIGGGPDGILGVFSIAFGDSSDEGAGRRVWPKC